jgi:hypothetical protein
MKKVLFSIAILLATLPFNRVAATNQKSYKNEINYGTLLITLPSATRVMLKLGEQLRSDKLTTGRIIKFEVWSDVKYKGETVIKTGAAAIGRVKSVDNHNSYNFEETIVLELISVQAVDGTNIDLNGTDAIFRAENTNEPVIVEPGMLLDARTLNSTEIRINF